MASSRQETQITWSTTEYVTVSTTGWQVSDAFTFNVEDWDADLMVSADCSSGSPGTSDYVDVWIQFTAGDILGDGGDDYPTTEHAEFLCRLNNFASATPGEDPARKIVPIRTASKGFKVAVYAANASSASVTVRARVITHRPQ